MTSYHWVTYWNKPTKRCRSNDGSPGIDGMTFEDVEEYGVRRFLEELGEDLRKRIYKPDPPLLANIYMNLLDRIVNKAGGYFARQGIRMIRYRVTRYGKRTLMIGYSPLTQMIGYSLAFSFQLSTFCFLLSTLFSLLSSLFSLLSTLYSLLSSPFSLIPSLFSLLPCLSILPGIPG